MNGVLLQGFHWYTTADGTHWANLAARAAEFKKAGFSAVWMPPAGKGAAGGSSVGYDTYDLFDLGEFDQKGSVRTKYGIKAEYLKAIKALKKEGMDVYADVVFNHKSGGDETERVSAQEIDPGNRNVTLSGWYDITAWTHFTFPGRKGKYSRFEWFWWCFDALDFNQDDPGAKKLYRLKDKMFSTEVSHEHGNDDYLFANDLDTRNEYVFGELRYWGEWILDTAEVTGFRIDAAKHIRASFFPAWLRHLRQRENKELFAVGEYWSGNVSDLLDYLNDTDRCMSLFDVPLHYTFCRASQMGSRFDMREIFDGALVKYDPVHAVTFVENHDTQPCQSLESTVEPWFKPIAYTIILLRREGYPSVFLADYDGATYNDKGRDVTLYSHKTILDVLLQARRDYGYGEQVDYINHWDTIGWVRMGDADHLPMAVVVSDGEGEGTKWMATGKPNTAFKDLTGHITDQLTTNADGWADFRCPAASVSVWVPA